MFPIDRSSRMTYARALLNNAAVAGNMYMMGLADSPDYKCSVCCKGNSGTCFDGLSTGG